MRNPDTHMELVLHRCTKIRVARYYPDIANAISLEILTEEGHGIELTMYRLELEDTDKMLKNWSDKDTTISRGQGPTDADDHELEQQLNEELEGIGVVILGPGNAAA